jgi:hypothetical protein
VFYLVHPCVAECIGNLANPRLAEIYLLLLGILSLHLDLGKPETQTGLTAKGFCVSLLAALIEVLSDNR